MLKVLLAGGGTAGHVNPALAIAEIIKKNYPDAEIAFAGNPEKIEAQLVPKAGYKFYPIKIEGFQRKINWTNIKRNIHAAGCLAKSGSRSKEIISDWKPDLVIGTGGYVSGPIVRKAAKMGIKTAVHEQNAFPGVTNKMLSKSVDEVMMTVEEASKYFPDAKHKTVTGLPVRNAFSTMSKQEARAQLGFDVVSVEAYINDHKEQRSLLLVRSTLEASNKLLHDYSSDANIDYKDINKELDKYTRAFDVIDVLYQSLRTSLNVYNTYETVSDRVTDYKNMLSDFHDKCLARGNIVSTDTLIISINVRALGKIADEGDNLYKSVSDLVLYATGAAACSTSDLLTVLNSINQSLDNIKKHLNVAYFETWKYIQVRIGYWKAQVYRAKTKQEIIEGAFGRWRRNGYLGKE